MSRGDLIHGDCFTVLPTLESNSVNLCITDIPYGCVNRQIGKMNCRRSMDKGSADSSPVDIPTLVQELARITSGSIYVFCSTEQISELRSRFIEQGLTTRQGIWHKSNPSPLNGQRMWLSGIENFIYARKPKATFNRFCKSPVLHGPAQRIKDFPCPKPIWLMEELIEASSNPGDSVMDPFAGSGSTLVAARDAGRQYLGIEKDESFYKLALARLNTHEIKRGFKCQR